MNSKRRSIQGELPDGIADREHGYVHNPNPPDQVAANRARFEQHQREIQHDRAAASEEIEHSQERVEQKYEQLIHDPAHQAFIPEQITHQTSDIPHDRGGQDRDINEGDEAIIISGDPILPRPVPKPTMPHGRRGTDADT